MANILQPLAHPMPAEISTIMARYPRQDGYLLNLFRTFANSARFARKAVPNLLDKESPLPLRIREIVILRVTANRNCAYEWGVHVAIFARAAKFTDDQVRATRLGPATDPIWPDKEQRLLQVVDELCLNAVVPDDLLDGFQRDWTLDQQLEILALCGTYTTISLVANTARLEREPFAVPFPT